MKVRKHATKKSRKRLAASGPAWRASLARACSSTTWSSSSASQLDTEAHASNTLSRPHTPAPSGRSQSACRSITLDRKEAYACTLRLREGPTVTSMALAAP